jgi:hypothetical protein
VSSPALEGDDQIKLRLRAAVEAGETYAVSALLAAGTRADAPDGTGETPLHTMSAWPGQAAQGVLLAAGARADAADRDRVMPLHCAAGMSTQAWCARSLMPASASKRAAPRTKRRWLTLCSMAPQTLRASCTQDARPCDWPLRWRSAGAWMRAPRWAGSRQGWCGKCSRWRGWSLVRRRPRVGAAPQRGRALTPDRAARLVPFRPITRRWPSAWVRVYLH